MESEMKMTERTYDVIVVGGGFAGISTIINLQEAKADLDMVLLEAGDSLGGRTQSLPVEGIPNATADLGGHFFGIGQQRVCKLVERLGLTESILDYCETHGPDPFGTCDLEGRSVSSPVSECYFELQGLDKNSTWEERAQLLLMCQRLQFLCSTIDGRRPWRSWNAKGLDQIPYSLYSEQTRGDPWMKDLLESGVRALWSHTVDQMSTLYVLWYIKNNGGFAQIWKDTKGSPQQYGLSCGMGGLLQEWSKHISKKTLVKLQSPVRAVKVLKKGNGGHSLVLVVLEDGTKFHARKVVVTATPASCGKIKFNPDLPLERQLIHKQQSGYAVKATVYYKQDWWNSSKFYPQGLSGTKHPTFGFLNGRKEDGIDWFINMSHPRGDYLALCLFIKSEWYDQLEQKDEKAVVQAIGNLLAAKFHDDARAKEIVACKICDWRKKEHVYGGPNTIFGPDVLASIEPVFNKPDYGCLYFGGAEYSTDFTGYIDGAICSGEFIAKQILEGDHVVPPGSGINYFCVCWEGLLYVLLSLVVGVFDSTKFGFWKGLLYGLLSLVVGVYDSTKFILYLLLSEYATGEKDKAY